MQMLQNIMTLVCFQLCMVAASWKYESWQGKVRENKPVIQVYSISHPNNLWLTVNMLPWCSTDKAKIYNQFYMDCLTSGRGIIRSRFTFIWILYIEQFERGRNVMHIIIPPWMEGQQTICTSPCHLMFYAHSNEPTRAETVQVMCLFMGRAH